MEWIGFIILWCIFGGIGAAIAQAKNRSTVEGFVLGLVCGCFGIIIVALLPKQLPKAPPGMRAVTCTRCNAVQNIDQTAPWFECWQCHTRVPTGVAPPPAPIPRLTETPEASNAERTRRVTCSHCGKALLTRPSAKKFRCYECNGVTEISPAS